MHPVDQIPILILHVLEADVTEDASIVDEDVDAAKGLDGGLDDPVTILDTVVVGDGLSTGSLDLFDNHVCGLE